MESWFRDRLADLFVFVWELMAWWKVDLETGWLISLLYVRANGLMESWFRDRLADLFVFMWELMAWWKVDLETGCLISLCVISDGWMESLFEDRLDDLLFFVWELMAGWRVDLETGCLISLCEKWWLDGKLIWRQAGWSPFLCVRADGWIESWFGDRLADLCLCVRANGLMESWFGNRVADLFAFVWEVVAGWKVDLKTVCLLCLISLSLCESWWLDGKLIWRQAVWLYCLLHES